MKTAREIIAGALDAEIWQMDAPVPTRADTEAFHRRRQQSVVSADAILAALAAEGFIVEAGPARIDLPARERRALDKLMERAGSIVTSEALIAAIWPDADGGPENAADVLSHVICRLRTGLGEGLRITTHRNLGYSLSRSTREGKT